MEMLPKTIEDRNYKNYVECDGKPTRLVKICQSENETVKVEFSQEGESLNSYNEILSLAGMASADVILYTVPVGKKLKLQSIDFSGENRAVYSVKNGVNTIAKKRSWLTIFDGNFLFLDYTLEAGEIIKLEVENKSNSTANFNANLQGRLLDA